MANFLKHYLKEIFLIGSICLVSLILILIFRSKSCDVTATIYAKIDGKTVEIQQIDLSKVIENDVFDVKIADYTITVEVKHNAIRVVDAPCHHKDCMRSGFTSSPNKPIICLDLNYTIVITSNDSSSDEDLVV